MIKWLIKWFSKKPKAKSIFCKDCLFNLFGHCKCAKSNYCESRVWDDNWCEYAKEGRIIE